MSCANEGVIDVVSFLAEYTLLCFMSLVLLTHQKNSKLVASFVALVSVTFNCGLSVMLCE